VEPTSIALPSSSTLVNPSILEDPEGRFSVVIPKNWHTSPAQGYSVLTDPDGAIKVYVLSIESNNAEQGIKAAWAIVDPAFALQPAKVETPPQEGVEQMVKITYQTDDPQRAVSATGQLVQGRVYAILTDSAAEAIARRQSQLTIIQTGYDIKAVKKVDLTGVAPKPFDAQIQAELEAYITEAMLRADIPGAAVAIVQNGRIVYEKGFGVREPGKPDPVTPETRMMIGSTGKTMTTMMMATVVDDGKMTWDTPAQQIYPNFAVADPQLSRQITMRNLVCACTGVPRRDLDILFNAGHLNAEGVVASLRTFEFFTPIGEAFQYSNQMVATGGYLAAHAAGSGTGDLYTDYLAQMQQRVFDPIGMDQTTFSFDVVQASGNYALPYSANLYGEYAPLPLTSEQVQKPFAPAGVSWSTAHDMARYLITELNRGVSPDGIRVVSLANLEETWQPQVPITAQASYGLGWVVEQYKGLRLIDHGGNTQGFTADLAFLPESNLGIVVLVNAAHSNNFNEAVRFRLLELAFGQPKVHDAQFVYRPKQTSLETAPPLAELDAAGVAPYLGAYHNEALGDITLRLEDGKLSLDAGEIVMELRPLAKPLGPAQYIAFDSALASLPVALGRDKDDQPTVTLLYTPPFVFTKIEPGAAAPTPVDLSGPQPKPVD
jgi:CubicO group peptidase (beta-lactamase class C family)